MTQPLRLLLRISLIANALMTLLVVPRLPLVSSRRLDSNVLRLAPERKPWELQKKLANELSGETSLHHPIPLFDARSLHGLDIVVSNFRAEEDFYLDAIPNPRWYSGNAKRDKARCCRRGTPSYSMCSTLSATFGSRNFTQLVSGLKSELLREQSKVASFVS